MILLRLFLRAQNHPISQTVFCQQGGCSQVLCLDVQSHDHAKSSILVAGSNQREMAIAVSPNTSSPRTIDGKHGEFRPRTVFVC